MGKRIYRRNDDSNQTTKWQQKLKLKGFAAQLDNVTKTLKTGGFDKAAIINRPQILARPLAVIGYGDTYRRTK